MKAIKPILGYLCRDQEHFVNILPEMLKEFLGSQAIHRELHIKNPSGFTIFWNEDKGDWRLRGEHEKTMGWYFSDSEVSKYFYIADPNMTLIIEKAVVIKEMRVTQANMEEFFENIRKMLA